MKVLVSLSLVLLLAAPVAAQEKFKQVWVTQADSGEVIRGRMVELSGESLAILTADNRTVEIPLARVLRIEAHGDSLKNGATIGAGVMGGLMLLACANMSASYCARAAPFQVALGAVLGAGIDALNGGRSTLYARPAPHATGKTVGFQLRLRF